MNRIINAIKQLWWASTIILLAPKPIETNMYIQYTKTVVNKRCCFYSCTALQPSRSGVIWWRLQISNGYTLLNSTSFVSYTASRLDRILMRMKGVIVFFWSVKPCVEGETYEPHQPKVNICEITTNCQKPFHICTKTDSFHRCAHVSSPLSEISWKTDHIDVHRTYFKAVRPNPTIMVIWKTVIIN